MSDLADAVLPLIRTRADLHRWSAANAHGSQMLEAVAILQEAAETDDPATVFVVTQRAIASALRVIMRADDSSGIIGDACRALLELHARLAGPALVRPSKLVDWIMTFQFDNACDFFTIDPVAYAPALGEKGVAAYRARLEEVAARLGPRPPDDETWRSEHRHEWLVLERNERRLAVLDRDVEAVIRTHARDRSVAAWLVDTARALDEIEQPDLAIEWARRSTEMGPVHQALKGADLWCRLLAEHRPGELLEARVEVFRRWPSSSTAAGLHRDAAEAWPAYRDEVLQRLSARPYDAVVLALHHLMDVRLAWDLAHRLELDDHHTWGDLVKAYEKVDRLAVLPVLTRLVENELREAGAQHYRVAARHLKKMRSLAAGSEHAAGVDTFVGELRETHRRRPRLQQEFDRAGLP